MVEISIVLFVLGACTGSFVNALVWRVHQQSLGKGRHSRAKKTTNYKLQTTNYSVLSGRSMCPNCRHKLTAKDLMPLFSWLWLRGKCRYCKKPISAQYPIVELSMGLIFVLSYIFWPSDLSALIEQALFISWLLTSVGLMALLIYDLKWMLLPNRILYPTAAIAVLGRLLYIILTDSNKAGILVDWGLAVLAASGIFWLIFYISKGKWIGYGDVRLGLITGTVLAAPVLGMLMIFTASLLGTLAVLPSLLAGRRTVTARIPFGPYLIIAAFLVLLFGQAVIDWYTGLI